MTAEMTHGRRMQLTGRPSPCSGRASGSASLRPNKPGERKRDSMLPNFVIIGAMKGGTTSLYHYLRMHPQVFMTEVKALHYFVADKNLARGPAWSERQFAGADSALAVGEASPDYTKFPIHDG